MLRFSNTDFTIVNTMGVTVKENNTTAQQNEMVIAVADLPRGVYFVKAKTNKGIGFKKNLKCKEALRLTYLLTHQDSFIKKFHQDY